MKFNFLKTNKTMRVVNRLIELLKKENLSDNKVKEKEKLKEELITKYNFYNPDILLNPENAIKTIKEKNKATEKVENTSTEGVINHKKENVALLKDLSEWVSKEDTEEYWRDRAQKIVIMELNDKCLAHFCNIDKDDKFTVFKKFFETLTAFPFMEKRHEAKELYISAASKFGFKNEVDSEMDEISKSTEYHYLNPDEMTEKQKELMLLYKERTGKDVKLGSSEIIIDNIPQTDAMLRSKEIMDKLNTKDKIIGFRSECNNFIFDITQKLNEINKMTENFINKINKYMNDTNVI